ERLRNAQGKLAEQGLRVAIGLSTVHAGLAAVPEAYREASWAREQAEHRGGVLELPAMSAIEYLTQSGDETARRLLRGPDPRVRRARPTRWRRRIDRGADGVCDNRFEHHARRLAPSRARKHGSLPAGEDRGGERNAPAAHRRRT